MRAFDRLLMISLKSDPDPFDCWYEALGAIPDRRILRAPSALDLVSAFVRLAEPRGPALVLVSGEVSNLQAAGWRFASPTLAVIDRSAPMVPGRLLGADTVLAVSRFDDHLLAEILALSRADLRHTFERARDWDSYGPDQLGPENNGFVEYDILDVVGATIGRLVITGLAPTKITLPQRRAAWCWASPRAAFPDTFQIVQRRLPGTGAIPAGAWVYLDGPFPAVAAQLDDVDGFVAHAIRRALDQPAIGHLWNLDREQFWTADPAELDHGRMFAARTSLWFVREPTPPPLEAARQITTLPQPR